MRGKFFIFLILVVSLLGGCLNTNRKILLDRELTSEDFLYFSPGMREFMDSKVMAVSEPAARLKRLIDAIFADTGMKFQYSDQKTFTASQAFAERKGNCLSYTAMLVLMARYAGFHACFYEVVNQSLWLRKSDKVFFNSHIIARIELSDRVLNIDFSQPVEGRRLVAHLVSDHRACAHYYNNLGAEALLAGQPGLAEIQFSKAIRHDRKFSAAWTNMGYLCSHSGRIAQAESCYKEAFAVDKNNVVAMMNLSRLYKEGKQFQEAEKLWKKVRKRYSKNPFYLFGLGLDAYNRGDYELARGYFKRAVSIQPYEPEFYIKLAGAYTKLSNYHKAEKCLRKARRLVATEAEKKRYDKKIRYLKTMHP